jgi:hypothetical protein
MVRHQADDDVRPATPGKVECTVQRVETGPRQCRGVPDVVEPGGRHQRLLGGDIKPTTDDRCGTRDSSAVCDPTAVLREKHPGGSLGGEDEGRGRRIHVLSLIRG